MCMNACIKEIDGFLMQYNHAMCYASWKQKENEKQYVTHDLKLATIVQTLNM